MKHFIIFTSDNGPTWVDHVDYNFFNSTGKFVNSRFTMKGSVQEGGNKSSYDCFLAKKIKPSSSSDHISAFYDFFATACEIAGDKNCEETDGISFLQNY